MATSRISSAAFRSTTSRSDSTSSNNFGGEHVRSGFGGALRQALVQEASREQTLRQKTTAAIVQRVTAFVQLRKEELLIKVKQLCQQRHVVTFLGKEDLHLGQRAQPQSKNPLVSLHLVEAGKLSVDRAEESVLSEFKTTIEERVSRRLDLEVTLELLQETSRDPDTGEVVLYYQVFVAV